ncbi:MAG: hypothetical protein HC789_23555 [Microcoleus sp. CSU_2_2]|nr:hypothetical protein [Microcoleus sp. SU_5_3]NJS13134.1 hypothetical protein [Microcoleus sp. CSU_2_2]
MDDNTKFILKVFLMSIALTLTIKYGGPILSIPSSNAIALIAVFTPSMIIAALLGWRSQQQQ